MALTKAQGLLLSNDELLAHLLENEAKRIQLAERLPFFPVNGHALRVERVDAANFGADPLFDDVTPITVTEGSAVPQSSLEASFELKLLVQDVKVNDYVAYDQSNVNSQVGVQLEAATRRMLYRFWKSFGVGDVTAGSGQEFSGVRKLVTAGQTISANDTTNYYIELIDLARLVAKVTANSGRPHVLWTSPSGVKNIQRAYFEKGLEPEYVMVNVPDSNGGFTQRPTIAFQGIPIYADEFYPATAESGGTGDSVGTFTDGTSIYAMVLGRGGIYGISPASFGTQMIRVKEVLNSSTAQTTFRVYWPCSLVLETQDALARLKFRAHPSTA